MSNRYNLMFGLLVIATLLITGCGGAATSAVEEREATQEVPVAPTVTEETEMIETPEEVEEEPVTLRVGWTEPIDCWNPWVCWSAYMHEELWGDPYFGRGTDHCEAVPTRLLDSWELSEDGRVWTLHLADGITFSNGEPGDVEALAGFIEWFASNSSVAGWYSGTENLESIEIVDDLTFRLTTEVPTPFFSYVEANFLYALPPSVYEELDEESVFQFENFPPIGTGPYVVTEWEPGSHVIFDARPEYHRGKPPIDRIILQIFANQDAMVSAVIAGDIDMTGFLAPEFYEDLEEAPNVTLYERVASNRFELEFNVASNGNKHPSIDDLAVREAIDYAINKQQILDVALLGYGAVCPTDWACPMILPDQHNPDLEVTPYDPDEAKQILEEAGYLDSDGDGILEDPEGLPLEFRLYYELEQAPALTIADMVSGWLKDIGIAVETEALELGTVNNLLAERDFDMFIYNMYTDLYAPFQMNWTMSCDSVEAGPDARNFTGYCDETFDDLVQTAYYAVERDTFEDNLFEAQAMINRERPFIILAGTSEVQGVRDDRFEFPPRLCHVDMGGWLSYESIMNATIK